ncbi:MAG: DUF72 domain-containing protein [Planctomycetes bacterium]|nr:DUF72 domain-containing protein [Planctomycetota bacterium]
MAIRFHVGTSGFSYDEWRPAFYPEGTKKDGMLRYYQSQLPAVELNNTFYRMPKAETVAKWRAQVGDGFRFAVKAPKSISWSNKLVDCGRLCEWLFAAVEPLGATLGCVFYQVPKWVRKDAAVLADFLTLQPAGIKVAFEFGHDSWLEDDALGLLREHDAALVVSDKDGEPEPEIRDTASWAYLRLRRPGYEDVDLQRWRDLLSGRGLSDAFVFMKHEDSCAGPALARRFLGLGGTASAP